MSRSSVVRAASLAAALLLGACSGEHGGNKAGGGTGAPPPGGRHASAEEFFAARVQPNLALCRSCHVSNGVADTDAGRRLLLSANPAEDYTRLRAAWEALGRGVDGNGLLTRPSGAEAHSGGAPWPAGSAAYADTRLLLACWNDASACAALTGGAPGPVTEAPPLLGNPGKHYFVNRLCDGAADTTPIDWNQDPRRLLTTEGGLIDSEAYAVHFNDPYELCHTETLFATQQRQNALRVAAGQKPIYSAKRDPATCGEWRAAVKAGHDWIAMSPTSSPREGAHGGGLTDMIYGGTDAQAWNNLWRVWGLPGRPDNFDEQLFERYGHTPPPAHIHNPYPRPGEEALLSETFGGTGRLPLGFAQGRDERGRYNGTLGINCFSCHAGQIGSGEIAGRDGRGNAPSYGANATGSYMGLPNTNTELGALLVDLMNAGQYRIPGATQSPLKMPAFGYLPLVNSTRGTNAADTEIEAIVVIRDFDTLEFSHVLSYPLHANTGDQDPPAWWWLSNKTRYLWFGGHSTDSSRGNMYFGSVNGLSGDEVKANEGIFEDVHQWSLSVEAPSYPGPVDTRLAEQGAVLFHEKDLWANGQNADIPRPKGNGSCAGCHGAYAPRYIADPRFLPTPKLAGMVGYTVPLEIVGTDPAQAEGWAQEMREQVSTFWWSYPDALPGYALPEEKTPLAELLDDYLLLGLEGADLADHLQRQLAGMGVLQPAGDVLATLAGTALTPVPELPLGSTAGRQKGACGFEEKTVGYVTPPLHGVWASAPYFHNGSVPDVWGVLKPADRPKVWRRQRTTTPVHFNQFETRLSGYDFDRLGWRHEVIACGDGGAGIPYYRCQPEQDLPAELGWIKDTLAGGLLWPTWVVPPPLGTEGLEARMIYNTNYYSKKNRGHAWTQALTDAERRALIEYLKTL